MRYHPLYCLPCQLILGLMFACTALVSSAVTASPTGGDLVLVENGRSLAPIVLFEGAPPLTRQAAEQLGEYIERISGARPELIEGTPDPLPERAIWVGYQPVLDELFPDVDFEFKHPEEILIASNPQHLVIVGKDVWLEDHLVFKGRNYTVNGRQLEYGTINAVYTFLQDYLGVRWLFPGDLGIDVMNSKAIAIAPGKYRYHPQFRLRSNLFRLSDMGDSRGLAQQWSRFQRLQLDSISMTTGGHVYDFWWRRFSESNPEYFALQPDGTRGFPSPTLVKRCKSNPDVWNQWGLDAEADLEADPLQRVFNAGINDSYNRGHCVCSGCLAWDHPEGEMFRYAWQGLSQEYVALSDRHVTFYNKLAEQLRQRFPDRPDLLVAGGSYGHWRPAPIAAVPHDNVLITNVANFFLRKDEMKETQMRNFADWGKLTDKQIWRPNTGPSVGWRTGMPDVPFLEVAADFRFAAEHNCVGLAFDTVWEHWSTQGPLYYLMGQLAWNPFVDEVMIMDDYFSRAYGPANDTMKAYWMLMQATRNQHFYSDTRGIHLTYTPEILTQAKNLLNQAMVQAADDPLYLKRIEWTAVGFEFTSLVIANLEMKSRLRGAGADREAIVAKMNANLDAIDQIIEQYPGAVNYRNSRHARLSEIQP